jgi:hypothetical protein
LGSLNVVGGVKEEETRNVAQSSGSQNCPFLKYHQWKKKTVVPPTEMLAQWVQGES